MHMQYLQSYFLDVLGVLNTFESEHTVYAENRGHGPLVLLLQPGGSIITAIHIREL